MCWDMVAFLHRPLREKLGVSGLDCQFCSYLCLSFHCKVVYPNQGSLISILFAWASLNSSQRTSPWRLAWELCRRWGKRYVRKRHHVIPIFLLGLLLFFCYTTVPFSVASWPVVKQLAFLYWNYFWNGYFCLLWRYSEKLKKVASFQALIFFFYSSVTLNLVVECVVYQQKIHVTLSYRMVLPAIYTALFCLPWKHSICVMSGCLKAAQPSVNCV